jgi:hypothetical protein
MGQLEMCRNWIKVMDADTRAAWGIPTDKFTALGTVYSAAKVLYEKATSSERTATITAECQAAFKAMVDTMADFKRRFLLVPPLTEANLVSLGLRPRKPPSPTGDPTAQVTINAIPTGRHELSLEIIYVTGNPDDRANKGYRIWYKAVPPGGEAPAGPEDLPKSFYTRRKKDKVSFEYGDSGKTAYMAVQVENDGKKGDWGPMVNLIIP